MKLKERFKAIKLRKRGKSYNEILKQVTASKGTLSLWLRDVKLTNEQREKLYVESRQKNAYRLAKHNQQRRIERTQMILADAQKEAPSLMRNHLFLAGLMLYWAEGDKSEDHEVVKFSNSDPAMITLMMHWFRKICNVPEHKFRIALHIHALHCRADIENYWSRVTKVPLKRFHKTQIKPTSLRQRRNGLYDGTCTIRISNKDLFRKIKGWKIAFLRIMSLESTRQ